MDTTIGCSEHFLRRLIDSQESKCDEHTSDTSLPICSCLGDVDDGGLNNDENNDNNGTVYNEIPVLHLEYKDCTGKLLDHVF